MAHYLFSIVIFMVTFAVTLAEPPSYGKRCNDLCKNEDCDQAEFSPNCVQVCIEVLKSDRCPKLKFQCSDYVVSGTKSCENNCGGFAGQCWCDYICTALGDCCCNFDDQCPEVGPSDITTDGDRSLTAWGQRCDELCENPLCDNAGFKTNCKQTCINHLKTERCPEIPFNCYDYPSVANGNSCESNCGGSALSCWCDPWCEAWGDCCCDFSTQCPGV